MEFRNTPLSGLKTQDNSHQLLSPNLKGISLGVPDAVYSSGAQRSIDQVCSLQKLSIYTTCNSGS